MPPMASKEEPKRSQVRRLRALGEPLRVSVTTSLALKPASATDLAAELGVPVGRIRYQLRRLRSEGVILVHDQRQRRGTLEQVFAADPRRAMALESQLLAEASSARRAWQAVVLRAIFGEVLEAIRAGALHHNYDHTIGRVPLTLDAAGFREVEAILTATVERVFVLREESLRRLEKAGAEPLRGLSALFHLE